VTFRRDVLTELEGHVGAGPVLSRLRPPHTFHSTPGPNLRRNTRLLAPIVCLPGETPDSLDELHRLHSFLRPGTVPKISIPLAFRGATAGTVHAADLPASYRRRTTRQAAPL
jgi:hypothetical protein